MFHWVVSSDKDVTVNTEIVASTSGIAEREAGEVDVTVRVSSDKIEEITPTASLITGGTDSGAASSFVAGEELDKKGWYLEEGIEERTSNNATPVSSEESYKRVVPYLRSIAPIPVGGCS